MEKMTKNKATRLIKAINLGTTFGSKASHANGKQKRVQVWRNQGLERVLNFAQDYFDSTPLNVEFSLSDYDDSLAFSEFQDADVHIIWLDTSRYMGMQSEAIQDFLLARCETLRTLTNVPIVVIDQDGFGCQERFEKMGIYFGNLLLFASSIKAQLIDARWSTVLGTQLNAHIHAEIGLWFAFRVLGYFWSNPVKLLVVDLDGTLYDGVLGEDGTDGISFSNDHLAAQAMLFDLKESGVILSIASKNEEEDVRQLLDSREEFALEFEDFIAPKIGWARKSDAVSAIRDFNGIGSDAVLFLDDNPSEIAEVAAHLPEASCNLVGEFGLPISIVLSYWPGLWPLSRASAEDRRRDTSARESREILRSKSSSHLDYLASLDMKADMFVDRPQDIFRAAELSRKTNQLNLSLSRLSEAHLRTRSLGHDEHVIVCSLEDKFAKLGLVALAVTRDSGEDIILDEFCISCRALGRKVETRILVECILSSTSGHLPNKVRIAYRKGPRNQPALSWLSEIIEVESTEDRLFVDVDFRSLLRRAAGQTHLKFEGRNYVD